MRVDDLAKDAKASGLTFQRTRRDAPGLHNERTSGRNTSGARKPDDLKEIVLTRGDQAGADTLASLLVRQGVQVGVADGRFRACGTDYDAGSYVINMAQPGKRLVRTLLDRQVDIDEDFVDRQERRRQIGLDTEIYDVTAWSLPLMMNVRAESCNRPVSVRTVPAASELIRVPALPVADADVAYLVPWGEITAVRFLSRALLAGLAVKSSDEAFTIRGGPRRRTDVARSVRSEPVRSVALSGLRGGVNSWPGGDRRW